MKKKKILSVIIAIVIIWLLFFLSEKIESDAYIVFMNISYVLIILALFAYQIKLRISMIKTLTHKIDPNKFLESYIESDGKKYTDERYIYEALAHVLIGNYDTAKELLKCVKPKKQNFLKTDAVSVLCHYLNSDFTLLKNAIADLKSHYSSVNNRKRDYYLNFALFIESLAFDDEPDTKLMKNYIRSMQKKDLIEAYVVSFLIGEIKYKTNDYTRAKEMFEHVKKNCTATVLAQKAAFYLQQIDIAQK